MTQEKTNPILGAIEQINTAFEVFKDTNDKRLDEEAKGNTARAKELSDQLGRIETDIVEGEKKKREGERQADIMSERVEILEALNDRPKATLAEKVHGEYNAAFMDWARSGMKDSQAEQRMREVIERGKGVKDVTIGTTTAGGYAVPEEIARDVDVLMLKQSDIQNEVKSIQVGTSDYKELITIRGGTSGWVGETGTRSATLTGTLREVVPTWGELYALPKISEWSAQDIFFNVEDWLVGDIADGMGKALDLAIWSGNASTKPTGLINSAPVAVADGSPQRAAAVFQYVPTDSASPQAFGADDVIDLQYALNRTYRHNAKFGCNTVTQGALRKLKSSNGDYYWQPSLQAGQPATLMGYSVFTYEDMADFSTADGIYLGFGDWRRAYTFVYRRELAITAEGITNPGYIRFYVRRRYGGIVANNDCLKFLKLSDT